MNEQNYKVLSKIISGVETGGQIYGNGKYDSYVPPYNSTDKEHTITLGWAQNYGSSARKLIQMIFDKDTKAFRKLDTCLPSIESMLSTDWVDTRWNPSTAQKNVLIKLISSDAGKEAQDELFIEHMKEFVADCETEYTSDIKAIMMYCEIRHLGEKGPVDRIFKRCNGNYSLDNIMSALKQDQGDTSSSNQVGDQKFWSRHQKCYEFINKYSVPEGAVKEVKKDMAFKKYNLSDSQIKQIARLAVQENGDGAVAYEVSLMANLFELQSKYTDIYKYIRNGGWFSRAEYWMDYGSASTSSINKTKDVLINGNRVLPKYVNEHDCFSDIKSATNNGKAITKTDRSQYKKDVTVIKNCYGSTYTFYCFPDKYSDPFGYTQEAYKKYGGEETKPQEKPASASDNINALIDVALNEVGYLEKASNSNLDNKTANAGSSNYTKYARDAFPSLQGLAWCGMFVDWCLIKAFGKSTANKMVNGLSADCDEIAKNYKAAGRFYKTPKKGDQILFIKNGNDYYHTGIVYDVTSSTVYTIEGNTSAGSQVIPNGGAVCKKSYAIGNSKIGGYGRPDYSLPTGVAPTPATTLNETSKWTGYVTADSLNVRTWAGTDNPTCSFSPLSYATAVGVCDSLKAENGDKWYYILYNNKHGFVSARYIDKTKPSAKPTAKKASDITVDKFLESCKNVMDIARKKGYKYGDSHAVNPTTDGIISCDRMVSKALYDLGFKDQRTGGEVVSSLDAWLKKHGFTRSTSTSAIKKGSILLVKHEGHNSITHAFVVTAFNKNNWVTSRYDAGSQERINSVQPIRNVTWGYRKDSIIVYNIPSSSSSSKSEASSGEKSTTWKATATSTYNGLKLRNDPAATTTVLCKLNKGDRFEIDGKTDGIYTHAKVGDQIGWVKTQYVKKD